MLAKTLALATLKTMATARKLVKKKHSEEKSDKKVLNYTEEDEKELSGPEDDVREGKCSEMTLALLCVSL